MLSVAAVCGWCPGGAGVNGADAEHLLDDRHDHADGVGDEERDFAGGLYEPSSWAGHGEEGRPAEGRAGSFATDPDDGLLDDLAGMIPIAIGLGEGAESRAPMGTCVVGGMVDFDVVDVDCDSRDVQSAGRRRCVAEEVDAE